MCLNLKVDLKDRGKDYNLSEESITLLLSNDSNNIVNFIKT